MAKFLKFRPRNIPELFRSQHFRRRVIAECIECNEIFSSKNEHTLAANLDMHGWKYYKGNEHDSEGPMCPKCQNSYR